jgi:hypothetical protein
MRFRTVHDVQQILQSFNRPSASDALSSSPTDSAGGRRETMLVDVNPPQLREKPQRSVARSNSSNTWQPALRVSSDSEPSLPVRQLFRQIEEHHEALQEVGITMLQQQVRLLEQHMLTTTTPTTLPQLWLVEHCNR